MWEAVRVELTHQQTQCTDAGTGEEGSDSIILQGFAPLSSTCSSLPLYNIFQQFLFCHIAMHINC